MTPDQLAKSGTEHAEQMALFCWANMAAKYGFSNANDQRTWSGEFSRKPFPDIAPVPELRWLHAVPNAGARGNAVAAAQLKAEGVKAGVADVFWPVPHREKWEQYPTIKHGLYIELKRFKGVPSDVTEQQIEFAKFVHQQGYCWSVAFGWREAARCIQEYHQRGEVSFSIKQFEVMGRLNK